MTNNVCKLFASVAENTFARKYSKAYYYVNCFRKDYKSFYNVMLNKYGRKLRKITLDGDDDSINRLIEQNCCSLESLYVDEISKIPILSGLKCMEFGIVNNGWNREQFTKFIDYNKQLEILGLYWIGFHVVDLLNTEHAKRTKIL